MATNRSTGEGSSNPPRGSPRDKTDKRTNRGKAPQQAEERPPGHFSLTEIMKKKLDEEQQQVQGPHTKRSRVCRFGRIELDILAENDPRGYRPQLQYPMDQQQKTLLDALWMARTHHSKLNACRALQFYFSKILEPPQGKNYSYYGLLNGPKKGIYCYYSSLLNAASMIPNPTYKGFYSFKEALLYVWNHSYDKEDKIFIEDEPRDGPLIENYEIEYRALREQINLLITEVAQLQKPPEEQAVPMATTPTPTEQNPDYAFVDQLLRDTEGEQEGRNPRNLR